jgi:radical SAM enzyme (TIGR01210 family)
MPDAGPYPLVIGDLDRFVLDRRGTRAAHDPWKYQGLIVEEERAANGERSRAATILLTGRECPWRCTMCDLWKYTTVGDTPAGAIAAQIKAARSVLDREPAPVDTIKLYNAGSFFDRRAVPDADYDDAAAAIGDLSRVVVESHPTLVLRAAARIERLLLLLAQHARRGGPATLEVAMGLETAHPDALERLNKRFTLDRFALAAQALADRGIALRVFLLIAPPFISAREQDDWLRRSLDAAFSCGASVVSLVPTRSGNGAMDALHRHGLFREPRLDQIEHSFELALQHAGGRGRVFVDLWDLARFTSCAACLETRRNRLHEINLQQTLVASIACHACGASRQ